MPPSSLCVALVLQGKLEVMQEQGAPVEGLLTRIKGWDPRADAQDFMLERLP